MESCGARGVMSITWSAVLDAQCSMVGAVGEESGARTVTVWAWASARRVPLDRKPSRGQALAACRHHTWATGGATAMVGGGVCSDFLPPPPPSGTIASKQG